MEPQENEELGISKAINAHEQAAAALGDLIENNSDPAYSEMLRRLEQNIEALRAKGAAAA
jgi:transcription elongation GreA/GreB family factor